MYNKIFLVFLLLFGMAFPTYAQDEEAVILFQAKGYEFPYDLQKPVRKVTLPTKLKEISGISVIKDDVLAAVQDEKGNIYIVDGTTGEISRKIDFAEDGDYEGITLVKKDAWVLKSNGDLFRVKDFLDDLKRKVKKYETPLSKINDMEGIVYDDVNNSLLLAAKGNPYIDKSGGKHKKAIYQYDLKEKKLNKKPEYIIDLEEIKYFKKYNTMARLGIDLMASLDESKGDVTFQPSGVAIHPVSRNIYVIGAVGDLLIIFHPNGEMLGLIALETYLFNQPEGICFGENNSLYIANEAGDKKATLLKFEPR